MELPDRLAGRHELPQVDGLGPHDAGERRAHLRAREHQLGLGERRAVARHRGPRRLHLGLPQGQRAGVRDRRAVSLPAPEPLVLITGDAGLLLHLQQLDLLHRDDRARPLHPVAVLGVVEPEQHLPPPDPSAALEGRVHPDDAAAYLRLHLDLRARPHRARPVHGDGTGAGRHRLGDREGHPGGRFPAGRLGPQGDHEGGRRRGSAQDGGGHEVAHASTHPVPTK